MYCPKCGTENAENAQVCQSCGSIMTTASAQAIGPTKTSGLAITALILGILSFLTFALTAIPAIICGIISLVKIEKSGGRITGKGLAIAGIITPVFSFVFVLLIAILMPALSRVKAQAQTVTCRSNLRQYSIGLRMYLDDNDYYFPETDKWLSSSSSSWVKKDQIPDGQLWPYLKSLDCHMCPRFAQLKKGTNSDDTAVSYVMNSYVGKSASILGNWLGAGVTGVKKELEVYRPSEVIVFTEENTWTIEGYSNYPFNDTHFTVGNASRQIDNYATYHNSPGDLDYGGANIVFVDGHVEYRPRGETDEELEEGFRLAWPKKEIPY